VKAFPSTDGTRHLLRLDRGEEVLGSLADFAVQERLPGATLSGVGAVEQTELGYFDLRRREYVRRVFADEMELLSLSGNIAWWSGEPVVHAHVLLGGADYAAVGGHLFRATIAVTGEILVAVLDTPLERALDERTGLKLLR